MTSHSPHTPPDGSAVSSNPDPSQTGQATAAVDDGDDDSLRLAGVRSANPFANEGTDAHGGSASNEGNGSREDAEYDPGPASAVSPGPDAATVAQNESVPTSAISPGVAGNADPFDAAAKRETEVSPSDDAEPQRDLQATNSNVNGDRAEKGTDIFAITDPFYHDRHPDSSGKDSDSGDSALQAAKPRVAFADHDNTVEKADTVEKAATHEDSSHDFLDKIKSTVSNAKDKIHLDSVKATGPFKRLNPTNVKMNVRFGDDPNNVGIIWRSRDNRKGRNSIVVPRASMAYPNLPPKNRPVYSSSFKGVGRNLYRMAFTFPYWDMAFWSGWSYTWGSVLFVIDSVWAWIPVGWGLDLGGISTYGVGLLFFFGALFYQLGATMAYLEAVNDGSFHGSAMKRFLEGHEEDKKKLLDEKIHSFFGHLHPMHHKRQHKEDEAEEERLRQVDPEAGWKTIHRRDRPGSIYPGGKMPAPRRGGVDLGEAEEGESHEYLTWRWWPTWHALRTHHIYEIGYIACSIQLFGATLYTWCGLDSVPFLTDGWTDTDWYGAYWFPEIFGSSCFLTASLMFLVETQEKWWKIQPNVVGWWIGFWAMVGSLGFLFIGVFGVIDQATGAHWAEFQSECSSTWGSFAYLLSSLCQWYEAVNKHPVEELFNEPGDIKSFQVHLP